MRFEDAGTRKRLRAAVAVVVAVWVVVIGADVVFPDAHSHPPHGPHAIGGHYTDFTAIFDHHHLQDGVTTEAPNSVAEAILPRATTSLVALGLLLVLASLNTALRAGALAVVRGPPRALPPSATGREVLTRLCIARC